MKIHESGENYLETVLVLKQRNGSVRSIDIAAEMGFSKPSISRAVGKLRDEGYLTVEAGGFIELTEMGRKAAEQIYERHNVIADFLERELGVCRETALLDACRIEHILSEESFSRMKSRVAQTTEEG